MERRRPAAVQGSLTKAYGGKGSAREAQRDTFQVSPEGKRGTRLENPVSILVGGAEPATQSNRENIGCTCESWLTQCGIPWLLLTGWLTSCSIEHKGLDKPTENLKEGIVGFEPFAPKTAYAWGRTNAIQEQTIKELQRPKPDTGPMPPALPSEQRFEISFSTCPRKWAGTDATVYLTLIGDHGQSQEIQFDGSAKGVFEKGSSNPFTRTATSYVGHVKQLRVRHDDTGKSSPWFLETIIVEDLVTKERRVFDCSEWISLSEGDRRIDRLLSFDTLGSDECPGCHRKVAHN